MLFNHDFNTHNIIVRNCFFHHNRARGILILARDVTIENCRFWRNEQAGIKIETGYTYDLWCEGYGVNNIKISNNTFDTVNPTGTRNQNFERDIFIGTYLKRDPSSEHTSYPILSNILIENNTFKDTFGLCAYIASAGNVIVRNNSFEYLRNDQELSGWEFSGGYTRETEGGMNANNPSFVTLSGKTRVGYEIDELIRALDEFLGFSNRHSAFLFGAGSLGSSLLHDGGLKQYGLDLVAAFDVKYELVGTYINHIPIQHLDKFEEIQRQTRVNIGVLAVPVEVAQETADRMVAGGIKAIWNFTPFRIRVPENIVVQNTSLYAHLAVMFNRLREEQELEARNVLKQTGL